MTIAGAIMVGVFMNTPVAWIDPASDIRTDRVSDHADGSVSKAVSGGRRDIGAGDGCDGCGYENGSHGIVLSTMNF